MITPLRTTALTVVAAALLASVPIGGQEQPAFGWLRFGQYLESLRQQVGIPGFSAVVVKDGRIVWERGFGFQDIGAQRRSEPDTPYHVVGLTQTLGAALALSCVERGRLDLDTPVRDLVPGFPEPDARLHHLLTHTSEGTPGVLFRYDLARLTSVTPAIERCWDGRSIRELITTEILDRLGMIDSVPGQDVVLPGVAEALPAEIFDAERLDRYRTVVARLAQAYGPGSNARPPLAAYPANTLDAASGLVTTARDLALFDAALSDFILLGADTIDRMWTPPMPLLPIARFPANAAAQPLPHALGWFVQSYEGRRLVWQFGRWPGVTSSIVLKVPAENLTFILLANNDGLAATAALETGDATSSLFVRQFLRFFFL